MMSFEHKYAFISGEGQEGEKVMFVTIYFLDSPIQRKTTKLKNSEERAQVVVFGRRFFECLLKFFIDNYVF